MKARGEVRRVGRGGVVGGLLRVAAVLLWLGVAWAYGLTAGTVSVELVVVVPVVVLVAGVVLVAVERAGGSAVVVAMAGGSVWLFAAVAWGEVAGSVLVGSVVVVLVARWRGKVG